MPEREMLEREIHQLRQIIRANAYALITKSTPIADMARLRANRHTHRHVGRTIETAEG
jgi:hypothetical protein